jgi:hypothetical protein
MSGKQNNTGTHALSSLMSSLLGSVTKTFEKKETLATASQWSSDIVSMMRPIVDGQTATGSRFAAVGAAVEAGASVEARAAVGASDCPIEWLFQLPLSKFPFSRTRLQESDRLNCSAPGQEHVLLELCPEIADSLDQKHIAVCPKGTFTSKWTEQFKTGDQIAIPDIVTSVVCTAPFEFYSSGGAIVIESMQGINGDHHVAFVNGFHMYLAKFISSRIICATEGATALVSGFDLPKDIATVLQSNKFDFSTVQNHSGSVCTDVDDNSRVWNAFRYIGGVVGPLYDGGVSKHSLDKYLSVGNNSAVSRL